MFRILIPTTSSHHKTLTTLIRLSAMIKLKTPLPFCISKTILLIIIPSNLFNTIYFSLCTLEKERSLSKGPTAPSPMIFFP